MSLKLSVTRNHNFSSGLVTRAALNAGATPTVSLTGSVDTAEIADASITNAKVSATAAISLSKLGDLDAGNILTGGGDFPVATSLKSTSNFSDPHHSISSNPGSTFKATLLLGNDTTTTTAVMSGDAELKADGTLYIDPTFVTGKLALVAQTSSPDATMIADTDTLLVVDSSETPDKYKKITFAHLKTSIDTTANAATDTSAGVTELATYSEVHIGTDAARTLTPINVNAHPAVPVSWGVFTGAEDDDNHSTRRTVDDSSEDPTSGSKYNITSINKNGVGDYTVTLTNCPSSNIMISGFANSWGTSTSGVTQTYKMSLILSQYATTGGGTDGSTSATVSFYVYDQADNATLENFQTAHLVFFAK